MKEYLTDDFIEDDIDYESFAKKAWWELMVLCSERQAKNITREEFIEEFCIWKARFKTVNQLSFFERITDKVAHEEGFC